MSSSSMADKTRQIAEARTALEASMKNIGSSLDSDLKSRASNLHSNSAALEKQQKALIKETANMKKETDKLKKVADQGMKDIKEIGDVQNWAEVLERDFLVLEETLRLVREGTESESESDWTSSSDGEREEDEEMGEEKDDNGVGVVKMNGDAGCSSASQLSSHDSASHDETMQDSLHPPDS